MQFYYGEPLYSIYWHIKQCFTYCGKFLVVITIILVSYYCLVGWGQVKVSLGLAGNH